MTVSPRPRRATGFALIVLAFAVAWIESGFAVGADAVIPMWDKPAHAVGALGLTLVASPTARWRKPTLVAVLGICVAWEVIQFVIEPFQGHPAFSYVVDTITDFLSDLAGALIALRAGRPTPGVPVVDPRSAARTT